MHESKFEAYMLRLWLNSPTADIRGAETTDGDCIVSGPLESKFELFVNDADPGIRFYQQLGFVVAERKTDGYTTLRSGAVVVCLSPRRTLIPLRWFGPVRHPPYGTEIVLYFDELETPRKRLLDAGYAPGPIRHQPWGVRDFRVRDPDRYYVRITEGRAVPNSSS